MAKKLPQKPVKMACDCGKLAGKGGNWAKNKSSCFAEKIALHKAIFYPLEPDVVKISWWVVNFVGNFVPEIKWWSPGKRPHLKANLRDVKVPRKLLSQVNFLGDIMGKWWAIKMMDQIVSKIGRTRVMPLWDDSDALQFLWSIESKGNTKIWQFKQWVLVKDDKRDSSSSSKIMIQINKYCGVPGSPCLS